MVGSLSLRRLRAHSSFACGRHAPAAPAVRFGGQPPVGRSRGAECAGHDKRHQSARCAPPPPAAVLAAAPRSRVRALPGAAATTRSQSKVSSAVQRIDRSIRTERSSAHRRACCSPSLSHGCVLSAESLFKALPCHAVGCERAELLRVREAFPLFSAQTWRAALPGSTHAAKVRFETVYSWPGNIWHASGVAAIWRSSLRRNEDPKPGRPYGAVCIGHCRRGVRALPVGMGNEHAREGGCAPRHSVTRCREALKRHGGSARRGLCGTHRMIVRNIPRPRSAAAWHALCCPLGWTMFYDVSGTSKACCAQGREQCDVQPIHSQLKCRMRTFDRVAHLLLAALEELPASAGKHCVTCVLRVASACCVCVLRLRVACCVCVACCVWVRACTRRAHR